MRTKTLIHNAPRVRPQLSSVYLFSVARIVWLAVFFSIGLDTLLARPGSVSNPTTSVGLFLALSVLIPVSLLTLAQTRIVTAIHSLKRRSHSGARFARTAAPAVVLGALALLSALKILAPILFARSPIVIALPVAVLLGGVFVARFINYSRQDEQRTYENPMLQVERWNVQTFLLVIIPLLAARAVGVIAAVLYSQDAIGEVTYYGYFVLSLVFIFCGRPILETFVTRCRGCWRPTSRAIATAFPHCPSCLPEFYGGRSDSSELR